MYVGDAQLDHMIDTSAHAIRAPRAGFHHSQISGLFGDTAVRQARHVRDMNLVDDRVLLGAERNRPVRPPPFRFGKLQVHHRGFSPVYRRGFRIGVQPEACLSVVVVLIQIEPPVQVARDGCAPRTDGVFLHRHDPIGSRGVPLGVQAHRHGLRDRRPHPESGLTLGVQRPHLPLVDEGIQNAHHHDALGREPLDGQPDVPGQIINRKRFG
ncbi:MAG: hypothetical protein BWX67_02223 [Thermotogae bacterium ADurb.Bin062]|nr:MAG: hypothetical protein BWX67_02223 [Thermotogota bacterium ADurb.Bin062]